MDEHEFDTMIDSYVESDPREHVKAGRKRTDDGERADIPQQTFEMIATPPRQSLASRAEQPVKRRDYARLDALLTEYKSELRDAIARERRDGALKPWNIADALRPWLSSLEVHGWSGPERVAIRSMLELGEEPTSVDFRAVTTNRQKITRDDVREWALGQRPKWLVDLPGSLLPSDYLARAGFPSDEKVAELKRVAERVESRQHIRTSGPGHMVGREYR
jgi:hypothetical protein